MAHVHRHPLVDRLRLDDDLPVSWEGSVIPCSLYTTILTFGVAGKSRFEEI